MTWLRLIKDNTDIGIDALILVDGIAITAEIVHTKHLHLSKTIIENNESQYSVQTINNVTLD